MPGTALTLASSLAATAFERSPTTRNGGGRTAGGGAARRVEAATVMWWTGAGKGSRGCSPTKPCGSFEPTDDHGTHEPEGERQAGRSPGPEARIGRPLPKRRRPVRGRTVVGSLDGHRRGAARRP